MLGRLLTRSTSLGLCKEERDFFDNVATACYATWWICVDHIPERGLQRETRRPEPDGNFHGQEGGLPSLNLPKWLCTTVATLSPESQGRFVYLLQDAGWRTRAQYECRIQ